MGPAAQQQQWPKVVFGPLGTPWAPWDPMWVGVMGAPQGQGGRPCQGCLAAAAAWQQQHGSNISLAATSVVAAGEVVVLPAPHWVPQGLGVEVEPM